MRTTRLTALALVLALLPAASAGADGVPVDVTDYVSSDLAADLTEYYGLDATAFSPAHRVTGLAADGTTRFLNRWVSVVSVDDTVAGVATVSIESQSNSPQLDRYIADPQFGRVVAALPDDVMLVDDDGAWSRMDGDQLIPILTEPVDAAAEPDTAPYGLLLAALILALLVAVLAVMRFRPSPGRELPHSAAQPADPAP